MTALQLGVRLPAERGHALDLGRGTVGIPAHQDLGRTRLGPDAEQLLATRVVQFPGQPGAFLEHGELPAALIQPGIGQRDRRVRGEETEQPLVAFRKSSRPPLAGSEDDAENIVAVPDRHAKEIRHIRVGGRPALEPGIGADVRDPQRLSLAQQHAEHAVLAGQRADLLLLPLRYAVVTNSAKDPWSSGTPSAAYLALTSDRADRTIICSTSRVDSCLATASTTWLTRCSTSSWLPAAGRPPAPPSPVLRLTPLTLRTLPAPSPGGTGRRT